MDDICFIPLQCSVAEYNKFEEVARSKNMDIGEWLLMVAKPHASEYAVNIHTGQVTQTPRVVGQPDNRGVVLLDNLEESKSHPCLNLAVGVYPHNFNSKSCMGTCTARSQNGRPCSFNKATADQCMYFRRKNNLDR